METSAMLYQNHQRRRNAISSRLKQRVDLTSELQLHSCLHIEKARFKMSAQRGSNVTKLIVLHRKIRNDKLDC